LSNPSDIKVLGELDVSGFSEYLHPIEGGKILAVGQETDDEGSILGLQISLFSASDPTDLSLIDRLVLLNKENQSTHSGASWEPKAFRYFTVDDLGILIIPMSRYSWNGWEQDNFDGFALFTIENDTISSRFDIDHEDYDNIRDNNCRNWCGYLPERSFVVDGDLITMKGQSVVSTNLNTEKIDWFFNMQKEVCCSS